MRRRPTYWENPDGSVSAHLTKGYVVTVDAADVHWLTNFLWCADDKSRAGKSKVYAINKAGYLHRKMMAAPVGLTIDHIDGDGLNNRRANLRLCSRTENNRNSRKARGRNGQPTSSRFKGVTRFRDRWEASIKSRVSGHFVKTYLGLFDHEEDAALAYNVAAKERFGNFAKVNLL